MKNKSNRHIPGLEKTDAVILCGGLGTRLRTEIGEAQKVMAQIGGRPFLDIVLRHLLGQGFRRVILCTGYKKENVSEYYQKNTLGMELVFSEEAEPLGTGGALKQAGEKIQSDPFFVLNGDSYCPFRFVDLLEFHFFKKAQATIVLTRTTGRKDVGSVSIDADDRITGFREKSAILPQQKGRRRVYVNAGIYCFGKEILSFMPSQGKFSLEQDFFPSLTDKRFYGYETAEDFIDIGTPQRYQASQEKLGNK
ncbi:MAG: nucleotidyltransferase family protein [Candidatus Omnitrophota bacterium]